MKTMIVPIDFSASTKYILKEAVIYAKATGSKICLLHVASLDLGFIIGDIGFQYLPELEESRKANLIIMGSHGRGILMEAILGSVSKNVINKSKIPILIVPPNQHHHEN